MAPREADDPAPDDALPADAGAGSGGDGRDPRRVPVVLERFAGYLLGGGPVEVADLGAAVADLPARVGTPTTPSTGRPRPTPTILTDAQARARPRGPGR